MSDCKTCNGRGQIQAGLAGEELEPCPECNPRACSQCHGEGVIDSGGFTPWGQPIDIPCPECELARFKEYAAIGAAWHADSSLEKWFPFSAQELAKLKELTPQSLRLMRKKARVSLKAMAAELGVSVARLRAIEVWNACAWADRYVEALTKLTV